MEEIKAPRQMIPTTLRVSPGGSTIQAIVKPTMVKASPAHASRCFQMNDRTRFILFYSPSCCSSRQLCYNYCTKYNLLSLFTFFRCELRPKIGYGR